MANILRRKGGGNLQRASNRLALSASAVSRDLPHAVMCRRSTSKHCFNLPHHCRCRFATVRSSVFAVVGDFATRLKGTIEMTGAHFTSVATLARFALLIFSTTALAGSALAQNTNPASTANFRTGLVVDPGVRGGGAGAGGPLSGLDADELAFFAA